MKVLITGISGFAGSHLAEFLLKKDNYKILGLDKFPDRIYQVKGIKDKIRIFPCDVCNFNSVYRVLKNFKPELIFHLAAQAVVRESWSIPRDSLETNIMGTLNILEALRKLDLKTRVQLACSAEEYGLVYEKELPVKETNPLRPLSPYAVGKIGQDMLGYQYYKSYRMFIVRTRAFNHIGPRMSDKFAIPNFAKQIALIEKKRQEPLIRVGDLAVIRDFSDVRDVVRAYWLSLTKGSAGEAYNICSGRGYSLREILKILLGFSRIPIKIKKDKSRLRPSDVVSLVGDSSKFRRRTGWKPEISLQITLKDILDYWRNKIQDDSCFGRRI
jgi:GDP-4-dehydro-6-deoxy-D-mannose reductase